MMKKIAFVISIILNAINVGAQTCSGIWGAPIVNQTFGQGVTGTLYYTPLSTYAPGVTTSTIFTTGYITDGYSILTQNVLNGASANWINKTDHTGNPNGLMFLINAPSTANTVFFEYTMNSLCPNTTMQLSLWMINANVPSLTTNPTYQYPNMSISVVDPVTNTVLATTNSGNVPADEDWHNYTLNFNNGSNTTVKLVLTNFSVGSGFGNDLAIDDIVVRPCIPNTTIAPKFDTTICDNASIPFVANVTGSPYTPSEYQWQYSSNGGATWINAQPASTNPAFTFNVLAANPGTYRIRFLTGPVGFSGNANCSAISDTSTITVGSKPPAPVINAVTSYCPGEAFVPFTTTATNVKWYTAATGGTGSTTAPTVNTSAPGTYTFFATQTNASGCESANRTLVTVTVHPGVTASYTYSIRYGCDQDTVDFVNTSAGGVNYQWNFGDNTGSNDQHPTHIFTRQNLYNVKLISYSTHCKDSVTQQVDVNHPLRAAFTVDVDTICQNQTVNFTNSSVTTIRNGIQPSYFWDFGDGVTDNTISPSHTYASSGIFKAMLVVTDFVPCTDTAWHIIYVDSTGMVSFVTSDSVLCAGKEILFTASYLSLGLNNYTWDFGDGTMVSGVNPAHHAYDVPGVFTVRFTTDYRICRNDTAKKDVTIRPYPQLNLGADTSMCPGDAPILVSDRINNNNPAASWLWNTGATTSSIMVTQPGIYHATVSVNGCSTADEMEVVKSCYLNVPNSFTPNGDGLNDYFFPRNVLSRELTLFRMQVFNRWGQIIFETNKNDGRGWDGKFNDVVQPQGAYIYLIEAIFANGVSEKHQGNVTLIR